MQKYLRSQFIISWVDNIPEKGGGDNQSFITPGGGGGVRVLTAFLFELTWYLLHHFSKRSRCHKKNGTTKGDFLEIQETWNFCDCHRLPTNDIQCDCK